MLTVAKVTARVAAGYASYLEGKTAPGELGDYYLKDGERVEAPGRWVAGANAVGCDPAERVAGGQLRALMAVKHPVSGVALRRVGASGQAVAAIDATFSAPKSVSAIWALADPQLRASIEAAHELAIDRAIAYATEQVAMIRQRVDAAHVEHIKATGVVASSWRHTTARAVNGRAPDPQLHSHVLLHAAVRGDGRLVAIDSKAWFVHRRELGGAYRTELAHELTKLGYQIERGTGRGGRYFEIHGVPRPLIQRWSSRTQQVQEAIQQRLTRRRAELLVTVAGGGSQAAQAKQTLEVMERWGRLQPAEDRLLRVSTRASKQPRTLGDLDRAWRATGQQHNFTAETVRTMRPQTMTAVDAPTVGRALTEFQATFTDREARAVALERSAGTTIREALTVLDQLHATGELVQLADGRLSTRAQRQIEHATIHDARQLAVSAATPIPAQSVSAAAATVNSRLAKAGGALSNEQRHALELACSQARLVVIEGQAGTGKSTVLQAVALAHQHAGRELLVTSTAALTAQRLAHDLVEVGVDARAYSTAALAHALQDGQLELSTATTIIHDEAALASTAEQHHLIDAAKQSGAQLILVGDPQQNRPVGAGGLWSMIEHPAQTVGAHVRLTTNLRARDPADQTDQQSFRAGRHHDALRGYQSRGRLHLAGEQRTTEDQALEAAHNDRAAGRHTLVITQTSNEHLDQLNARAQAIRAHAGELGTRAIKLTDKPYRLHEGDEIQLRHSIHHPTHGPLANGTSATIRHIAPDQTALLKLADGRQVTLTQQQLQKADARLGYVQHPFPAQGATTDTTHVIVAEHATRQGTYVAITRARQQTHIYASVEPDLGEEPLSWLSDIVGRDEPERPAIAVPLARAPEPPITQPREREATDRPARELEHVIEPVIEPVIEHDLGWEI